MKLATVFGTSLKKRFISMVPLLVSIFAVILFLLPNNSKLIEIKDYKISFFSSDKIADHKSGNQ